MTSPKYMILAFVVIWLVLASGCGLLKKPQESAKKEFQEVKKEKSPLIESAKREDFGCWPPSCSIVKDPYGRQICEDWKAGREVTWPPDCIYAQTPECIRLCEYETENTNKTAQSAPMTPTFEMDFPKTPADFLFHTKAPSCVDPDNEYNTQLVYARPSNAKDKYQETAKTLRKWIANANGIVNNEAEKFGMTADIKIACSDDEISVLNVVLPKSLSEYNTGDGKATSVIASDLQVLGYKGGKTRYIVYYDGRADGCEGGKATCTGQSTAQEPDDTLSEDNIYTKGPYYAIIYDAGISEIPQKYNTEIDMLAPVIMLHEYSHTLGAVQLSAPNSAGEGHCKDEPPLDKQGSDVLCKSDKEGTVFDDACKDSGFVMHFDCNNDDYFNPKPDPGSYLATHWNLGSPLNKYFKFG